MRIYSDKIESGAALRQLAEGLPISIAVQPVKAKVRQHGWAVATAGNTNRWKNTGTRGASVLKAASWDTHGEWFARIFQVDPKAVIVAASRYNGAQSFHNQTKGRFL